MHLSALRTGCCHGLGASRCSSGAAQRALGAPHAARLLVTSRATGDKDGKSWGEIGAEVLGVAKDVVGKLKDTATSAIEGLTASRPKAPERRQQQQRGGPLYRPEEDSRQLPQFPGGPGGLLGGIVGGLVGQAVKGLASQLEKAAEETRSVSEDAARRIQADARVRQRLGRVVVGPPMSQSVSSQSINGRMSKSVSLLLPLYSSTGGGAPLAQAQVTHAEGAGLQQQQRSRILVRMPEGDALVVDGDDSSSTGVGDADGEVVEAEFRDLK